MCGVTASIGGSGNANHVHGMVEQIKHRGDPDNIKVTTVPRHHLSSAVVDEVVFGFTRLPIIDVNGPMQPHTNASSEVSNDATVYSCVNGEIFNFAALRQQHKNRMWGNSDTGVVPFLYDFYGLDFVKYLDGFYSIVLFDSKTNLFVACVDRMAVKPLFYCQVGKIFYISSELKGFLGVPNLLEQYPNIEIKKLAPGSMITGRLGSVDIKFSFYYSFGAISQNPVMPCPIRYRELLEGAVKKRLICDPSVRVGLSFRWY